MLIRRRACLLGLLACWASVISAQAVRDTAGSANLPVTKISIFSSGLAYYEHSGELNGPAEVNLPFRPEAVNDALKSLVLNDPASASPSVTYQSEQALFQILRSLKIDLSDSPDMAAILSRLRGTEVTITAPAPVSGRVMGIEYRHSASFPGFETREPWLSLHTDQGIRVFNLNDVGTLNFKNPQIGADLKRALDIIESSHNDHARNLTVKLPGSGRRAVTLSYVIPAPVWKVSYRLDLGRDTEKPVFQGWAIVDNDSDSDWNNVELSLVAGRPASFVQNLYPPYYLSRPVLPLSIAGAAAGASHDSGYSASPRTESRASAQMKVARDFAQYAEAEESFNVESAAVTPAAAFGAATGAAAGDQFEFTVKTPVSLDRRMSAMLPLVESTVDVRKALIFSGAAAGGRNQHPRLGAELVNTSRMKLPAGPVTVYDGGYAGDALIEFWNDGEKRLISYGEDLSVTAAVTDSSSRSTVSVTIAGGVMTINRSHEYTKTYTFKNNSAQKKTIIVEHPKNHDAILESPQADEQTPSLYRFSAVLPAEGELAFQVRESRPIMERIVLAQYRPEFFLSYISSREIPAAVQSALRQAVNLWNAVTAAEAAVAEAENRRTFLVNEQERIRKNIEVTGNQTELGQEYLKRLQSLDNDIDAAALETEKLAANVKNAHKDYSDYLGSLNL